jgi:hypothetical protein
MTNIKGSLDDLRTFINGSVDEVNAPLLSSLYGRYHPIQAGSTLLNAPSAATYMIGASTQGAWNPTTPNAASSVFYFDPAQHGVSPKTGKLNLETQVITNATAPGTTTYTVGMYPVTGIPGAASVNPEVTLGTVVTGSTAAVVNPGAAGDTRAVSGDFTMPSAGVYAMALVVSANAAVGAIQIVTGKLFMRAV